MTAKCGAGLDLIRIQLSNSRADTLSRSRGVFARVLPEVSALRDRAQGSRVRAAPAVSCAKCTERKRTRAYRFSGGIRPSLRNGFTASFVLSPVTGFVATVVALRRAVTDVRANLTPASGRQDHTTSPYALTRVRLARASASTASHRAFRDDREPPLLSGETGELIALICPTG